MNTELPFENRQEETNVYDDWRVTRTLAQRTDRDWKLGLQEYGPWELGKDDRDPSTSRQELRLLT